MRGLMTIRRRGRGPRGAPYAHWLSPGHPAITTCSPALAPSRCVMRLETRWPFRMSYASSKRCKASSWGPEGLYLVLRQLGSPFADQVREEQPPACTA